MNSKNTFQHTGECKENDSSVNDKMFRFYLEHATDSFLNGSLGGHETTTYSGVKTRFERIKNNNRKELIMRACQELESVLEECFDKKDITPYHLGIRDIHICFSKSKEDHESGIDDDSETIDCDIWEEKSPTNFGDDKK